MPGDYGLSLIVHESIHIRQGPLLAFTAYGELEAWQAGFRVLDALNGDQNLSTTQQDIVNLPLNAEPANLMNAVTLMEKDQNGTYLGGYLLYLTIPTYIEIGLAGQILAR